ncbi:MAG: hypothetical protein Q8R00_00485 [Candidatus Nanoarchaeia archaeon]|nr:hypothetical protein [Candidatus Nanoarchaeia archaeon]
MTQQFNLDAPMGPQTKGIMSKAKELSDLLNNGFEIDGKFLIKKTSEGKIEEIYVQSILNRELYAPSNLLAYSLYINKKIR